MKMTRMMIQLPRNLKAKLDALRTQGTTASGLIRNLVEQYFATGKPKRKRAA
jgi:metal-responsive CopG/Arc/MetJ family transcriptional regulator